MCSCRAFATLAVGATLALAVVSTRTDDVFAWTIEPPLTAALLGATYAGALAIFIPTSFERAWANARVGVPAELLLSVLMLVATLLHLDKFHLESGEPVAVVVAWIWLVVYVVVPPALIVLLVRQVRAPGVDPPRTLPLTAWLRGALLIYGAVFVVGGAVLFAIPEDVAPHWPWAISALTGRAIAAWMVALGAAALQGVYENDLRRVRWGFAGFAVIGFVGLVGVARFSDDVLWDAGGWLLVATLVAMLVAGGVGYVRAAGAATAD